MTIKKEDGGIGGMGFRNIYAFNLTMLEKQGWRL